MPNDRWIPLSRLFRLVGGLARLPSGWRRIAVAFFYGFCCHLLFSVAVIAMIVAMFFGMSRSFGTVPHPWSFLVNGLLVLQFPLTHSVLLTRRGHEWLARLAPQPFGQTLSTTTYALIASLQLLLLFAFWTPSGVVWWAADGFAYWILGGLYAAAWVLLIIASYDAGAEVQSGALGWVSLARNIKPVFPDMPDAGLFRIIRQPIYLSFALTTWTVPVWTPDQLILAISLTTYCVFAPLLKEKRFSAQFGERFSAYRKRVPYMVPGIFRRSSR